MISEAEQSRVDYEAELNRSGVQPCEFKVLIKLDPVEEVSQGGIVIRTGSATEREQMAQINGTLVAMGGNAFMDWRPPKPQLGQKVIIAKYGGLMTEGADGEEYRLCNDKEVAGIWTRDPRKQYAEVKPFYTSERKAPEGD